MKNVINAPILLILLILILISCTKEVSVEIPPHDSKLVLNSLFCNNQKVIVNLGYSVNIWSNANNGICDAEIKLYENGIFIETLVSLDSGKYISSLIPEIEKVYELKVVANGFSDIACKDSIPDFPNIRSLSFRDSLYIDDEKNSISQAFVTIIDPIEKQNFYEIILKLKYIPPHGSDFVITDAISYRNNSDIVLQNENILEYYPKSLVFSDELFNGDEYNMLIDFSGPGHISNHNGITEMQGYDFILIFEVRSISRGLYLYKKQLLKHLYNQDSDIWDGVGDPVQMYTNVKGGYGIFAGYSQISDTINE